MAELMRFGVSIEEGLLQKFDGWLTRHGWANRSEAIRDLIRDRLVKEKWSTRGEPVVATLTFVYDHHVPGLQNRLTRYQHDHEGLVLSAMHVHLDHHHCVEVLVLKGPADQIQALADRVLGTRGVSHGELVRTVPSQGV